MRWLRVGSSNKPIFAAWDIFLNEYQGAADGIIGLAVAKDAQQKFATCKFFVD